jgi:predicted 3-demethylubiquinone-9 3-methyltransferase (glyoxalase superfamily)
MQKITPFLWFNNNAEEAVQFYTSVFKEAKVGKVVRYGDAVPDLKGQVLTASLELAGQQFTLLNGGPKFKFTEAVSFVVHCESQEEVDYYWEKLSEGGEESMCGWLKDRFGLSWQIVPNRLVTLLSDKDAAKASRVMQAMLQMRKIDIALLEEAQQGNASVAV